MSQTIWSTINPASTSGTQLATLLDDFKDAVVSGMTGTSRPANLAAGGSWIDTTNEGTPNFYWSYKVYTGTYDAEVFRVNLTTGATSFAGTDSSFIITKTSADAVGALAKFIKARIASSGQVLAGDVIGELRFVGTANDASTPTVAQLKVVAIDNETATASGAYFVWTSTLTGVAVAAEQMRLWNGKLGIGTQAPDCSLHVDSATGIKSAYTADSANAALVTLEKARITGTGASQINDLLAQVNMNAQDSTSTKTLVAQVEAKALEAHTGTQRGTKLTVRTTTTAAAAVSDKVVIGDKVETLVALKHTALEFDPAAVATTATIAQLSSAKALVEFSGATTTSIQGINSGLASKIITLHNGSTATVTLSHEDSGATALDRLKLPNSLSVDITAGNTAELFYSTVDTRWKLKSLTGLSGVNARTTTTYYSNGTWTAPVGITRALVQTSRFPGMGESGQRAALAYMFLKDMDGLVYSSGDNSLGILGDGTIAAKSSPVAVVGSLQFSKIAMGGTYAFGLDSMGQCYSWGDGSQGQLANNAITHKSSPTAIVGSLRFSDIYSSAGDTVTGHAFAFGLTKNGTAYGWGYNLLGNLGDGTIVAKSSPSAVVGGLTFRKIIAVGLGSQGHALGITKAGAAYGWGDNTSGQLGLNNNTNKSSPSAVVGGLTFSDISGNSQQAFGLTAAGALYSWGDKGNGELGLGNLTGRSSPSVVVGSLVFSKMFPYAMTFLTSTGAAYSWGQNTNGNLGDGSSVAKSSPVAVVGGLLFTKIEASGKGGTAILGLTTTGAAYTWGSNLHGELGDGTIVPKSSPVAVVGGLTFADVKAGYGFFYGVTTSGAIYSWGDNTQGCLGDGTVAAKSSPVVVLGALSAEAREIVGGEWVTVVPGNTYSIYTGYMPLFGNTVLGKEAVDVVAIQYG